MPRIIPNEDLELLKKADLLAEKHGLNQTELASELGLAVQSLRNRAERHGLDFTNVVQVRAKIGGKRIWDLIADGEIAAPTEEPVAAGV